MSNINQNKFYTLVIRPSEDYWVALCLENGIVGQGETQDQAIENIQAAIESMTDIYRTEPELVRSISIPELHEFLEISNVDRERVNSDRREIYELHKIYA
jgi:predicted RNase H-like HicB family nuclease